MSELRQTAHQDQLMRRRTFKLLFSMAPLTITKTRKQYYFLHRNLFMLSHLIKYTKCAQQMYGYIVEIHKRKGRQKLHIKIRDSNDIEEIQVIFKSKNLFEKHTRQKNSSEIETAYL